MANPNAAFLLPLIRSSLPYWWRQRVTDAQLAEWGKLLLKEWESSQLFGEPDTMPLLVRRLGMLKGDLEWYGGMSLDVAGNEVTRNAGPERAALLQLIAICLARLAAADRP